jgi:hypothetical protein
MKPEIPAPDRSPIPGRRVFLARMVGGTGLLALPSAPRQFVPSSLETPPGRRASEVIERENQQAGSIDWQLTRVLPDRDGYRSPWIEGYCSKQSVKAGETIEIMVSTRPRKSFRIELFRMGYYGRRGARLVRELGPFDGMEQPDPTPGPGNRHECQWKPSAGLTIPEKGRGNLHSLDKRQRAGLTTAGP